MVGTALKRRFRMLSTIFVQSQDVDVKKWDLCSKSGGFVPFRQCPKVNEKKSAAKSALRISLKLGFGGYL